MPTEKIRICGTDCPHYKEKSYISFNSRFYCDIDDQDALPFRKCRFEVDS